jgi:group I intron endonuclease
MKTGIYKIINSENDKFYIGSATHFYNRKSDHLRRLRLGIHKNTHLQNSFNKYGQDKFSFILIEECEKTVLSIREQYYIDTLKPDYNICTKVEGRWGLTHKEESKDKISDSIKKYHLEIGHSQETKNKIASTLKGRKQSPETIEKRKQANIKAWELKKLNNI